MLRDWESTVLRYWESAGRVKSSETAVIILPTLPTWYLLLKLTIAYLSVISLRTAYWFTGGHVAWRPLLIGYCQATWRTPCFSIGGIFVTCRWIVSLLAVIWARGRKEAYDWLGRRDEVLWLVARPLTAISSVYIPQYRSVIWQGLTTTDFWSLFFRTEVCLPTLNNLTRPFFPRPRGNPILLNWQVVQWPVLWLPTIRLYLDPVVLVTGLHRPLVNLLLWAGYYLQG